MDVLYLLIPLSLLAILGIGVLLWWAIKGGQFEDLDGPGIQIIMDDDDPAPGTPLIFASQDQPLARGAHDRANRIQ